MKYIAIIFIFIIALKTLSFGKYNWSNKNRRASIGVFILFVILIGICAVVAIQ